MENTGSLLRKLFIPLAAVVALAVTLPAFAGPIVIDDFTVPVSPTVYVINLLDANPLNKTFVGPSANILGTERDVTVQVSGSSGPVSAVGTVGAGIFLFNTATPGAFAQLEYSGLAKAGLGGVDLVAGTNNSIKLDFDYLDAGGGPNMPLGIVLASKSGSATYAGTVAPNLSAFSVSVPFASFVPAGVFSFTSVDNIFVVLNGSSHDNVDFQLRGIAAVPEPSALLLAGVGGAFLVGRRLHRRRKT